MSFLTGCAVGPDYVKPSAPESPGWIERGDPRIKSEPTDLSAWWTVFQDPVLDALIGLAYAQNLDLRIAGIRILEARARLGIAVGSRYPQLQQARGSAARQESSENAANTLNPDLSYWDYQVGFDAAWELDFWGKFRRAVESGVADFEASIASYDDALVSLTAEVARVYVQLRTLQERLAFARENVKIQERGFQIANARFQGGVVTELDVQQAKSLLKDTQARIPRLEVGIRQSKNALAVLLGRLPYEMDAVLGQEMKPIPAAPEQVAVGIPAELLRRRPDIRFAERALAAQSPLIGVAKADLYPHFELFGSIGLRSSSARFTKAGGVSGSNFRDLFDTDSIELFAGPSFRWDFLNYGRIKNQVRVEDARLQQLMVNYENTILRAAQEVEDGLVAFLRTQEEVNYLAESVQAYARSVDLSLIQYREGLTDFQRVLDSQRFLTQEQDLLADTKGLEAQSLIAVYKALGGGWRMREGNDFVPVETREEMEKRTDWGKLLTPAALALPPTEEDRSKWRSPDW
jgi:NodT family efflux transporter outer membrane factor (OMF) lipoprotein